MRRLLFLLTLAAPLVAQITVTPNIGLQVPYYNQQNWQVPIQYDLNLLDLLLSGNAPLINVNTWSSTFTYASGSIAVYGGADYISLQTANVGHNPSVSPTWWYQIPTTPVSGFNIVPGANITCSPLVLGYCTGVVTISATSGFGTVNTGTTGQIAWYAANGTTLSGESQVTVPQGGTADASFIPNAPIVGGVTSTGALQQPVSAGTAGQPLLSGGASAVPVFGPLVLESNATLYNIGSGFTLLHPGSGNNTWFGSGACTDLGSGGSSNTCIGTAAGTSNSGNEVTAIGADALLEVNGGGNTGVGAGAGTCLNSANPCTVFNTGATDSTYVGDRTTAAAAADTYEIVIGAGAHGNGSHTTTIADSANTDNYLYGHNHIADVIGPVSAPSGSCPTNGVTVLSQDGAKTTCLSSIWVTSTGGGGTTTNPLTLAVSGGAAPGSTFNGSAGVTADYHSVGAVQNTLPNNIRLDVIGASYTHGLDAQGEVLMTYSGGSGYSGTGTCTVTGGTCSIAPTCAAQVRPGGSSLVVTLTGFGYACTVAPTGATFSGFTGGSSATATFTLAGTYSTGTYTAGAFWKTALTLSALSGHGPSGGTITYTDYAVPSSTIADAIASYGTNGYTAFCGNGSYNNFALVGGDLARNCISGVTGSSQAPQTATQCYTSWTTLVRSLIADGCKVIVYTPLPSGNVDAQTTLAVFVPQWTAFRQFMINGVQCTTANTPNCDFNFMADLGGVVQDPFDTIAFAPDHVHPTGGFHTNVLAPLFNTALINGGGPTALGAIPGNILISGNVTSEGGNVSAYKNFIGAGGIFTGVPGGSGTTGGLATGYAGNTAYMFCDYTSSSHTANCKITGRHADGSGGVDYITLASDTGAATFSSSITANGTVKSTGEIAGGGPFTLTGCGTVTGLVGGALAGGFMSGSACGSTVVITTGNTAPNCYGGGSLNDHTTNTVVYRETGCNSTTVTFTLISGTPGATDLYDWAVAREY